jgi:hypothetical protein
MVKFVKECEDNYKIITPTEENPFEETVGIIANVRKVVKYFRFSSIKNGVLQEKSSSELGHNLE